jgi:hypothetical protein
MDWAPHDPVLRTAQAGGATVRDLRAIMDARGAPVTADAMRSRLRRLRLVAARDVRESRIAKAVAHGPRPAAEESAVEPEEPAELPRDLRTPEPIPHHEATVETLPSRLLVLSDAHNPIIDVRAFDAVVARARDYRPDRIVIAGDWFDCWLISGHNHEAERLFTPGARLQEEFDSARPRMQALADVAPVEFIIGNHEHRLSRLVDAHPGLFGLDALAWHRLAGLPSNVRVHPYGTQLRIGPLSILHGDRMGSKFGLPIHAAYWMLNRYAGRNVIFGHSHRLEVRHRAYPDEHGRMHIYTAINCAHLTDHRQHRAYAVDPDWHPGYCEVDFWRDGDRPRFTAAAVPIIEGRFCRDGKVYGKAWQ